MVMVVISSCIVPIARKVRVAITSVKVRGHIIGLSTPVCLQRKNYLPGKANLCTAVCATQGEVLRPDGTTRPSYKGQSTSDYMGCLTLSKYTELTETGILGASEDPFYDPY
jgi:S-(hydroxymethyl)glutathione dehydrogenase/alcohol dehydrogenase